MGPDCPILSEVGTARYMVYICPGTGGQDLSLCVVVWEAETSEPHSPNCCYLGLFDMNRWYHCQMPVALRSVLWSVHSAEGCFRNWGGRY